MLTNIDISKICPHPNNPRKDLGDLSELADSIKSKGILQNLTIVPKDPELYQKKISGKKAYTGEYTAIIGHRRLAAAKLAGLTEVPCSISDMGEKEQLATMLLENMQRNDLTVYEQAQGFQMMLDLGDSVGDIARQTGFSDITIRKRVKLLELDKDKFAKSMERGATLSDYEALNKIKDIKLRNKVLDKIGTSNFEWELKQALTKEKKEKNKPILLAALKEFATKITDKETSKLRYVQYISLEDAKFTRPKDADTKKYFFTVSEHAICLYSEATKESAPQKSAEEIAREKKIKQINRLFKQAYELRLAFVKSFRVSANTRDAVDQMAVETLFDGVYLDTNTFHAIFRAVYGIEKKFRNSWESEEKGETYKDALARILSDNADQAKGTLLFIGVYCRLENGSKACVDYTGRYESNAQLKRLYKYLENVGYAVSDEERSLCDGTHELYVKDGGN